MTFLDFIEFHDFLQIFMTFSIYSWFSYDLLGNITKKLEKTRGYGGSDAKVLPNTGLITHNQYD